MVLLPETDREGARVVADKIRQGVAAVVIDEHGEQITIGVSIGLGEWVAGRSLDDIMAAADEAMYERQAAGPAEGRTAATALGDGVGPRRRPAAEAARRVAVERR